MLLKLIGVTCYHSLLIVSYRTELPLLLTIDESVSVQVVLYLLWLCPKAVAQCLQRVILLVTKEHVHA